MPGRTATHHGADSAEDLTRRQSGIACQAHWLPDRLRARRAVSESGRPEQLLHGEPHPGNLLSTRTGPLFIDFETYCRGPIEFDLAHAPDDVGDHYPGVDRGLLPRLPDPHAGDDHHLALGSRGPVPQRPPARRRVAERTPEGNGSVWIGRPPARGEQVGPRCGYGGLLVSPLHGRGAVAGRPRAVRAAGITPACARSSPVYCLHNRGPWDHHPRIRWEQSITACWVSDPQRAWPSGSCGLTSGISVRRTRSLARTGRSRVRSASGMPAGCAATTRRGSCPGRRRCRSRRGGR